jgi:4-alpha-glucanotransferase
VRSRDNWGIGDFADLKLLIRWLAPRGAGFIGLNPLHALAPADPLRASPYSASSRHFLNILYIAVPAIPEFATCAAALAHTNARDFTARLDALRSADLVNYAGVADLKFEVLELLFRDFVERHLAADTERAAAFRSFIAAGGALLQSHACFDALDQHFRATLGTPSGWMSWPEEYRDAGGAPARHFAATHPMRVEFHLYLQWVAHEQLTGAQSLARELGMPIGLYGDYAVGSNPAGSETWVDQASYRMGAEIGAPPDPLALRGQGWGIPLRLDHVMSLFRLWWVAAGDPPTEGAYVHYPLDKLLTVLALESARAGCLVVGEDLGVVPDEMRRAMPEYGLYHYKVLLFEKDGSRFRRPNEFVARALGTRLLDALRQEGLQPAAPATASEPFTAQLANALHLYLSRSPTKLVALQIEDLLGMVDPVNVPGTDREYPNWQRKLTLDLEAMAGRADLDAALAAVNETRNAA